MRDPRNGVGARFGPHSKWTCGPANFGKHGLRLRLQEQPFQVLAALVDRPGRSSPGTNWFAGSGRDGTVVDYEGGLNAAVTRLRQALSDSAETPRYVETVARRGYRWIAPVERIDEKPRFHHRRRRPRARFSIFHRRGPYAGRHRTRRGHVVGCSRALAPRGTRRSRFTPLTTGLGAERNVSFSPDGTQIVYEWEQEDHRQRHIYIKVVGAGDPIPFDVWIRRRVWSGVVPRSAA